MTTGTRAIASGRLFFNGIDGAAPEIIPLTEVVAREVGNSLERLHLHDGVLQSLTGIRFRLQALADEPDAPSSMRDRLLAVERAIAIEQRELRLFIEDLSPVPRRRAAGGTVAAGQAPAVDTTKARETGAAIGEKVAEGANEAQTALLDASLTAKIKSKMALDDTVKAARIDVDTSRGVVTLTGTVRSEAERLARGVRWRFARGWE